MRPGRFATLADALEWLDAHINYEATPPVRQSRPSLERMRTLVRLMGDPERQYPVIHVTGTNGKGSTAAMITALLGARGLRTGTYTSPNLSRVHERLSVDGQPIDDDAFRDLLASMADLELLTEERPTRFEVLTAAAFSWFADVPVAAAVVEVGLGGSWDSTNVVEADVAVITNISYDHTDVLGSTLEEIATEKSGIVKVGSRVVIGETSADLAALIQERAVAAGAAEVWLAGRDFGCRANRVALGGRLCDLETPNGWQRDVLVPLHGAHQGRNAACALAAAELFFGGSMPQHLVDQAFADVRVPGRLEVLGRRPLCMVDGAHNVAGARALADAVAEEFTVDGPKVAVLGMLRGRDPASLIQPLVAVGIRTVVACQPASPRAIDAATVAEAAEAVGATAEIVVDVGDAVDRGRALATEDGMCLIAGSLYVVASARDHVLGSTGPLC